MPMPHSCKRRPSVCAIETAKRLAHATAALVLAVLLAVARGAAAGGDATGDASPPKDNRAAGSLDDVAAEAYIFFYPLVSMEITRRAQVNSPAGSSPGVGPPNKFSNARDLLTPAFRDVVRPNADTLYSIAWLDLRKGPLVVSAPDTAGRYYLLPLIDMWSDAFAAPGARTSGTAAQSWAVAPPGWNGSIPAGVQRIDAPTRWVWVIGRTQVNGQSDVPAARKVQDGYSIVPLALWGTPGGAAYQPEHAVDKSVDVKTPPLIQVDNLLADKYFPLAAELMITNPPHITDWSQLARIGRLGLTPGKPFSWDAASAEVKAALTQGRAAGLAQMKAAGPNIAPVRNGWQVNIQSMGVYGIDYLKRAVVAQVGLGANQPADAIYPLNLADAAGKPLASPGKYQLRFPKGALPPASAFWSVTLYDAAGFGVPNPLNRMSVGSQTGLEPNTDGSVTLYMQPSPPGAGREANWLPSPASGGFSLTMRVYAPQARALDGAWAPPQVVKVG